MRVDRGGGKEFIGENSRSGKETSIQKKGGKVKLTAGDQDEIQISQKGKSLNIIVNQSDAYLLTPEESKNLEISAGSGTVSVDQNVTIPIKGHRPKSDKMPDSRIDSSVTAGRREETELTAKITRNFLKAELQSNFPSSSPESLATPPAFQAPADDQGTAGSPKSRLQDLSSDRSSATDITLPEGKDSVPLRATKKTAMRNPVEPTETSDSSNDSSVTAGKREEVGLTANITRNFLRSELQSNSPSPFPESLPKSPPLQKPAQAGGMVENSKSGLRDLTSEHSSATNIRLPEANNFAPVVPSEKSEMRETIKPMETSVDPASGEIPDVPLSLMTTDARANVIQNAIDRPFSSNTDDTILSVVLHSENPGEFSKVVDGAGGKIIATQLQSEGAKVLWDSLAGAFDRPDLALNPSEAALTKGLFTGEDEQIQRYIPRSEQPLALQIDGLKDHMDLAQIDRPAALCVVLENVFRESAGRPPVVVHELREKIFDILNNPAITPEERAGLFDALRNDVQLTEFQMRQIVSLPLVTIFESVIKDLTTVRQARIEFFQNEIQSAIQSYGPESVAVEIAKAEKSEFLDGIDSQINSFQSLKEIASEMFSGPSHPLIKADKMIHSLLTEFMPPQTRLVSVLDRMSEGATIVQNGKLQESFQKIERLGIPELRQVAFPGAQFLNALPAVSQILAELPFPDLRPFQLLDDLRKGTFHTHVKQFKDTLQKFIESPPSQHSLNQLNRWRAIYRESNEHIDQKPLLQESEKLIQELTGGILFERWKALDNAASELNLDSRMSNVIESLKSGRELIISFRNNHFVQALTSLNQRMAGSPAILQIIQQGLHLATTGSAFFRGLFNREWERPLTQALKKSPGNKELTEVHGILTDTLNLFEPLESIDHLNPFIQYHKQLGLLRDETLLRDLIHQYQTK